MPLNTIPQIVLFWLFFTSMPLGSNRFFVFISSIIGQAVGGAVGGLVFIALLLIGIYLLHSHMTTPKGGVMVS